MLRGLAFLDACVVRHGADRVNAEWNGIGAEWMWEPVRVWLTRRFSVFAPAAYIHDVRVGFSSEGDFTSHHANLELYANCRELARHSSRPRLYAIVAGVFYLACELFGRRF